MSGVGAIRSMAERARQNVERVIVGKSDVIDLVLVALLCEGHVLVEDVPGIGKTMLAKSIARTLDCSFRRIQFTPDLLPSDVTGVSFFNQRTQEFEFRPGPVFAQVVLADEINRATPRTQSALLECMEERQVTLEGETRPLPRPFLVMATQNPIELEGTFPLPEAQLDRFLLRLRIGYPSESEERAIVRRFRAGSPLDELPPVIDQAELVAMQRLSREVHVSEVVEDYIVRLVRASRLHASVELGASPRGTLALYRASQAMAALAGRDYVLPDDAKRLAPAVLTHRLITSAQSRLRGKAAAEVMAEVLASVPVPVEEELGA
jgi:MoxR-like ATPase